MAPTVGSQTIGAIFFVLCLQVIVDQGSGFNVPSEVLSDCHEIIDQVAIRYKIHGDADIEIYFPSLQGRGHLH